jgi:hypothetical protein
MDPNRPDDPPASPETPAGPEPATSRALWPTFLRRTLAEEEVSVREPEKAAPRDEAPMGDPPAGC